MVTPEAERREKSIAEHVRGLSEESAGLVREQAQLIRDDLVAELKRLGLGGGMLGGAGVLGVGAFGALTAGPGRTLGGGQRGAPAGARPPRRGGKRGALAVTVLYGGAAGGLVVAGREQLRKTAAEAAETLGRDVQAAADGVRDAG